MSPSKFLSIPENFSAHGGRVDHLIDVVHWFMAALGTGWFIFFAFCLIRFRASVHPKASYHGVRNHISSHLEIAVVIIEAVLLLGFAFPLWKERTDTWQTVQKQDPVRVRVIGWQFGWTYHYPGKDGKFGRINPLVRTANNDVALDLNDPNAQDDFIASNLKIAKGRPAILNITSNDVIHNYAIVPMRIQQDAIPGREIPMWFTPTKTLETSVVCAQLCGEKHGDMVGQMEVVEDKAFRAWFDAESETAIKNHAPKAAATASR
ncbi:MAG: cytochrome c oxidase subunit II [Verrucomicrobiaceae bacterium]|nr:MAG: cytochrome c oxidase subunit II [Verrucomicrobiaceae bacterium]